MTMGIGRRIRFRRTFSSGASTAFAAWAAGHDDPTKTGDGTGQSAFPDDVLLAKGTQFQYGLLHGVRLRIHSGSARTLTDIRLVLKVFPGGRFYQDPALLDPFTTEDALHLYDSGTLNSGLTPSSTASFHVVDFATPRPYSGPLIIGFEQNSTGSGNLDVTGFLIIEEGQR